MSISEMRPTSDDWCSNYPGDKVRVYMNESRERNSDGISVPCWVVGVTGTDDILCNKGYVDKKEARAVYDRILMADDVTKDFCINEIGLEW